ncbi:putative xylogalacturonan beta-1,3-xylosyltransferase [Medicago truncatula]|uniref:Exostosin-like protein n=1 Tax=Medicago truncatula TaxID=3880 RepID=A0A072TT39_MEDTR|nr:probable arabinosyltransferase ARAD1 isoform X1 [Medicago truncatula]KEH20592.1 exostosin-like protein [Medicago truncatula]RHN42478.1 putative xylogalacturonan beta-1,3-xylosyltransferase [Medicago truncatula]
MYEKVILTFIFVFLLIISYSIFIGTLDIRSYFYQSPTLQPAPCKPDPPLRVYMYDLPPRFNVGMITRRNTSESPVTVRDFPRWPGNWGLKKQHSVEYWMMGSLLHDGDGGEAVRVSDPELADAFFVPFFSSLSFNTHGHTMTDPATEIDRKLQVDLMEFLKKSKYWQRSKGRDHVFPMTHPNAFRFLRNQLNDTIQVVVDFGRYPKGMSNLNKDVVSPYVHVVDSYTDDEPQDPYEIRSTLLFFRGRTFRKDEGIVRAKLMGILSGYSDVHYERSVATGANIKASSKGMRSSKFCLHPAGDTPSSCRLFDAIASHCVPVIVSDQIELPFEDEIDYSQFSLFFSFKEALQPGYMVDQLRKVPKQKWTEMWRQVKNISHHYEFQYPPKREDAVNMLWRQVKHKLPGVRLSIHRTRRLKISDWWRKR